MKVRVNLDGRKLAEDLNRCTCPDRLRWLNWLRGHRFPCPKSYRRP